MVEFFRSFFETNPMGLYVFLGGIVAVIYLLNETKGIQKIFDYLPCVFWVYFIPMVFATLGFFPAKSPVYSTLTDYFLPASLFLLFLSSNIPDIMKLGPRAIIVMVSGSIGVVLGAVVGVLAIIPFYKMGYLPQEHLPVLWKGVGALSGSWIGGSANMAAVWESVTNKNQTQIEGQIFSVIAVIDVCVGYIWMAVVIAMATYQKKIDKWIKADTTQIESVNKRMEQIIASESKLITTPKVLFMFALAFAMALLCKIGGETLEVVLKGKITSPLWSSVLGYYSIMIVLITIAGLAFSLTPVSRLDGYGASKIGYAMLYLVLARIGAKGDLASIKDYPAYLILGVVWILTHAAVLLATMKIIKAPVFFASTASQANIGGPVSAPVVAAAYQPNLAVVGLLMAIIGNILGTFMGLFMVAPIIQKLVQMFI